MADRTKITRGLDVACGLGLPTAGLVKEYIVTRTRRQRQYRNSINAKVSEAGIKVQSGRKGNVTKELKVTEERLRQSPKDGQGWIMYLDYNYRH